MLPESVDVVVVGAGNAALCAALAAADHGASVLVLERAPRAERSGNTHFTAGAFRVAYDGVDQLRALMPDLTDDEIASTDFGTYTEDQFFDDMARVTEYRADPELVDLLVGDDGIHGVRVRCQGRTADVRAKAVVLACGGFEANAEWRTRYLGPGWELAKVRGTRFNTGDGIRMALDAGAAATGNWSGCHAVAWERNAPEFGDLAVGDQFQKHSYPWGVYLNAKGRRFVDEGADFRNYTYAKYGRVILQQPGQFAWQIFDAKVKQQLRDEYRIKQVTKRVASSLEELVRQ